MKTVLLIIIGYLMGSIPTGVILARQLNSGLDLRKVGSGNIGATNVSRALGVKWGVVTMLGDCLKGLIPVLIASWWSRGAPMTMALTALAAIMGHIYPIFLKMRGGKGVATSLGVWLGISGPVAGAVLFIWGGAAIVARSSAAGALSAAIALPIIALGFIDKSVGIYFTLAVINSITIYMTHHENIRKIIRGENQKSSNSLSDPR